MCAKIGPSFQGVRYVRSCKPFSIPRRAICNESSFAVKCQTFVTQLHPHTAGEADAYMGHRCCQKAPCLHLVIRILHLRGLSGSEDVMGQKRNTILSALDLLLQRHAARSRQVCLFSWSVAQKLICSCEPCEPTQDTSSLSVSLNVSHLSG